MLQAIVIYRALIAMITMEKVAYTYILIRHYVIGIQLAFDLGAVH